jgi:FkbM family methyltransferase
LQIGANEGLRNDPLRDFIVRDGWRGVFVEPLPDVFPLLKKNYAYLVGGVRLEFLNAAVSSVTGSLPFYSFRESFLAGKPLEERLHLLRKASFDRDQVVQATSGLGDVTDLITSIDVPCRTLDEIVSESALPRVDIVVVDVEGYDHEVVRRIRFDAWKTHTVIFEYKHIPDGVLAELQDMLRSNGFTLRNDHEDMMATRLL